jgi:hypothetical protein
MANQSENCNETTTYSPYFVKKKFNADRAEREHVLTFSLLRHCQRFLASPDCTSLDPASSDDRETSIATKRSAWPDSYAPPPRRRPRPLPRLLPTRLVPLPSHDDSRSPPRARARAIPAPAVDEPLAVLLLPWPARPPLRRSCIYGLYILCVFNFPSSSMFSPVDRPQSMTSRFRACMRGCSFGRR